MPLDQRIRQAIGEAVAEADQTEPLTRRLAAWFEAVASGIEDKNDREAAARHIDLLFKATTIGPDPGESKS